MFIMSPSQFVQHVGQDNSSCPSSKLWSRLFGPSPSPDGFHQGFVIGDDFLLFQGFTNASSGTTALPSTTVPAPDGYQMYVDSTTTASGASRLAGVSGGVVRLAPGLTNHHLAMMHSGEFAAIADASGSDFLTIWEARVRLASQVTTGSTYFGLANAASCVDGGLISGTGGLILATGAGIGFRTLDADPDGIDFVYKKNSSGTEVVVKELAKTATADSWVKLGFVYDPLAPAAKRIAIYVDGVELSTYVTAANIAAAMFPDAITLGTLLACKSEGGAVSRLADVDWWYCYQSRTQN